MTQRGRTRHSVARANVAKSVCSVSHCAPVMTAGVNQAGQVLLDLLRTCMLLAMNTLARSSRSSRSQSGLRTVSVVRCRVLSGGGAGG